MSKGTVILRQVLKAVLLAILILFAVIILSIVSLFFGQHVPETIFHLIAGHGIFLSKNLSAMSTNADTWVPGLVAYLIASVMIHRWLRAWAIKRDRPWSWTRSFSVALLLPTLFAVSFIVPGIILQLKLLSSEKFISRHGSGSAYISMTLDARNYSSVIAGYKNMRGQYPLTLQALFEDKEFSGIFRMQGFVRYGESAAEPWIYLGGAINGKQGEGLPILVSPVFEYEPGPARIVVTEDCEQQVIPAEDLDLWISKALSATISTQGN